MCYNPAMSPERRIHRRKFEKKSREPELISYKHLRLITPQEAERLGINSEGPVFVSPNIKDKQQCACGSDFSPIIYHKGIVESQHYHPNNHEMPESGGIYYYRRPTKHLDEIISMFEAAWIAILDPVPSSMDLPMQMASRRQNKSSEEVNILQIRAFSGRRELREGFLVSDQWGTNLFPSITKNHPFITEWGFRVNEDGEIDFFTHSPPRTPRNPLSPQSNKESR